jgi:glutathione synthase/RimK-type ligase-like ATP-grasp enzyme
MFSGNMSKFVLVVGTSKEGKQEGYFRSACEKLNIVFFVVNAKEVSLKDLPVLVAGDILYRNSASNRAKNIEKLLMVEGVSTFHKNPGTLFLGRKTSYYQNLKAGVPVIPTYPFLPIDRDELAYSVEFVGGFPLIIKVMGKSKGVGVIKIDSVEGYKSVIDYLVSIDASVLIRKFIPHTHYGRLIVIGDKVVASNRTKVPDNEFRSNTSENTDDNRFSFVFDENIQKIAVEAVSSNGLDFGGVDIIFDSETNLPYVAEVNFPCQFEYAQKITGIDVALLMVDFLLKKSLKVAD